MAEKEFPDIIAFINPKSGRKLGSKVYKRLVELLDEENVYDVRDGGLLRGLEKNKNRKNLKILACGGDGTIGWVLSTMDKVNFKYGRPYVAPLPLGTGNDMSRVLQWGDYYGGENLYKWLLRIKNNGIPCVMDRWKLRIHRIDDEHIEQVKNEINDLYSKKKNDVSKTDEEEMNSSSGESDESTTSEEDKVTKKKKLSSESDDDEDSNSEEKVKNANVDSESKSSKSPKPSKAKNPKANKDNGEENDQKSPKQEKKKIKSNDEEIEKKSPKQEKKKTKSNDEEVEQKSPKQEKKKTKSNDVESEQKSPKQEKKKTKFNDVESEQKSPKQEKKKTKSNDVESEQKSPKQEKKKTKSNDEEVEQKSPKQEKKKTKSNDEKSGGEETSQHENDVEEFVIHNYFSIGIDSEVAYDFHVKRESSPKLFPHQTINKAWYGIYGIKNGVRGLSKKPLYKKVKLEIDGQVVKLPKSIKSLLCLQIPSYSSGVNPWGDSSDTKNQISPPSICDGMFEVLGTNGILHLGRLRANIGRGVRIGQAKSCVITTLKPIASQIDGEPVIIPPSKFYIDKTIDGNMIYNLKENKEHKFVKITGKEPVRFQEPLKKKKKKKSKE